MGNCTNNYTTTGGCGCTAPETGTNASCGCGGSVGGTNDSTENCTCRDAFATALRLLCSGDAAGLVDFNRFAFIGGNFLIGTYRICPCARTGTFDNLADTLAGAFNRFTPCSCDLIEISGTVYDATPVADPALLPELFDALSTALNGTTGAEAVVTALNALAPLLDPNSGAFSPDLQAAFVPLLGGCSCPQIDADEVSLCSLTAIAFEAAGPEGGIQDANYRALRQLLSQMLRPSCPPPCPPCTPPKPQPCTVPEGCKNTGILASLDRCGMARNLSLTAGPLLLRDVSLLGAVGDVLVLANDEDGRIYFVCGENVEFVG